MNQNSTYSQHRCITALNSYYAYAYTTYVNRFYTMQVLQCIHLLNVDVLSGNQSCHYLNSFVNKSFSWYNKWNLGTLKASFPWLNMLCFIVKVKLFDFRHFFAFSLLPWLFSLCWCCGSWRPPSLKGRSYTSTRKKTKTQSNRCMTKLSSLDICCCATGQHIRCSSRYVDYNLRFQN